MFGVGTASDFYAMKKRTAGLLVGDRGGEPTVQVARPLLGDRRCCLGGGDCQRNITLSKHCASKKRNQNQPKTQQFFLFLRRELIGIVEKAGFFTKITSFASCEPFRTDAVSRLGQSLRMHPSDCWRLTAPRRN